VFADQTAKAGQNFSRRTHRGNPAALHHHRPIPDGRPAHRQDPFTHMGDHLVSEQRAGVICHGEFTFFPAVSGLVFANEDARYTSSNNS
jgi:hypothetical protein